MINVMIIIAVFYFPFKKIEVPKFKFKKSENFLQSNWQWIGPEGGIIPKPLSHPSLNDRVLALSLTDVWRKENGESFFEIVNGMEYIFPLYGSPGVLSSPSKGIVASYNNLYFTQDNWQTIDTTPWSSEIMFIAGDHSDTIYLISFPDSLFHSLDGGQTFNFVSQIPGISILADTNYVISVDPSNSGNLGIFAFGPPAIFYWSQDGGNTFEMRDTLLLETITSLRISPFNSNTMLAFSPDTGVLMTTDGGYTWNQLYTLPLFGVLLPVDGVFTYPDTFLISSVINPGIFKAYQQFGNWFVQVVDTTFVPFIFERAGNRIYCGSNNGIYVSFNSGNSWTNLKDSLRACSFIERGMFSIVRDTVGIIDMGGIPFKIYGMQAFEMNFLGHPSYFGYSNIEISPNSANNIYLTNSHIRLSGTNLVIHTLWVSNDGGNYFSPVNDSTGLLSYSDMMLGNSDSTIFMYNDSNLIRSFDGGTSFDTIFSISSGIDLCDNFKDTIFILTENDTIFYSYDAGTSFGFLYYLPGVNDMSYDELNRVLYICDFTNLYSLNILTNSFDTVFVSSYGINNIYASEDGWVYALLTDTLNQTQFIYYTQGSGNPVFADTVLSNVYFGGIIAGNGNLVYAHSGGRSIFATNLIKVDEYKTTHKCRLILGTVFKDYIYLNSNISGLKFEIYDFSGRKLNHRINLLNSRIKISGLKSGVYILKEKNTGKKFKVVKVD